MTIAITRPQKKDSEEIKQFFTTVITQTFKDYGFYEKYRQDIAKEVTRQITVLQKDFDSNGQDTHFLLAKAEKKIIGTIAYGTANNDIKTYYKHDLENIPEIKSVYILPEYQGKGIGTMLFNAILKVLQKNGFKEFCLDSGYPKAQQFWKKKLGNPVKIIVNRWGAGNDYMIWHYKL